MINMRDIYTDWSCRTIRDRQYYITDVIIINQLLDYEKKSELDLTYSNIGICRLFKDIKTEIDKYNKEDIIDTYEATLQVNTLEISKNLCRLLDYLDYLDHLNSKHDEKERIIKCIVSYILKFIFDFVDHYKILYKYYFNIFNLYQLFEAFISYIVDTYNNYDLVELFSTTILKLSDSIEEVKVETISYTVYSKFKSFLIEQRDELLNNYKNERMITE